MRAGLDRDFRTIFSIVGFRASRVRLRCSGIAFGLSPSGIESLSVRANLVANGGHQRDEKKENEKRQEDHTADDGYENDPPELTLGVVESEDTTEGCSRVGSLGGLQFFA